MEPIYQVRKIGNHWEVGAYSNDEQWLMSSWHETFKQAIDACNAMNGEPSKTEPKKDDSGPAFPIPGQQKGEWRETRTSGMTLRDYFAAKALQGMLADSDSCPSSNEAVALYAYELADLMLAARAK